MSSRKTLKSVSVEGLKPTITLTPVIELCGEGCRIHHIKSDSIARDGRDTFVPLRHVSKQKRRIFELEAENEKLRELVDQMYRDMQGVLDMSTDTVFVDSIGTLRDMMDLHMQAMAELGMPPADYESRMRELGAEVE